MELANFYLAWAAGGGSAGGVSATASGDKTLKHLEAALTHARAPTARSSLPFDVASQLADVEQRALRELIRAHTAAGNATRAAALKAEYRALLHGAMPR